jgi:hypothetical protein
MVFRWTIAGQREDSILLVIQPPENGQRISVQIPSRDYWSDLKGLTDGRRESVNALYKPTTSALVERCIRAAKSTDWNPSRSATQLDFKIKDLLPDEEISKHDHSNEDT